jgi:PAS domain S-box-containing protein
VNQDANTSKGAAPPRSALTRLLEEITRKSNQGCTLDELFDYLYDHLHDLVPYNRIAVALADETGSRLHIIAARSDGKVVLGRGYSGEIAGSSLEPLMREGRIRVINNLQDYLEKKAASESTRLIVREGMKSSLTLPLVIESKSVGVVFFSSRLADAYRPEHEELLRSIVGQVAMAVERTRLVDGLRERTEFLENILHNTVDAIIVVDAQNRIKTWNDGARRIFGYGAEEMLGKSYDLLLPEEARGGGESLETQEAVEKDEFARFSERIRRAKDGRRLSVDIASTLLRDKKGRAVGRSCIIRDVTEVKKIQQELLRTQSLAAVGELAATVAHEIKNPLAGISGAIQVLAEGMPKNDGRREIVGEILDQVRRLDNTVRDLLNFARPITPVRQDIDLAESVASAWKLLSAQPAAEPVRFELVAAGPVPARGDPQLLRQVWVNLFQNAIEAMPRGGSLRVCLRPGAVPAVEIRDAGQGIDPAALEKIWRPFFTTKTRGTGLGLPIVKKIIDAHGGRIWCESQPAQGTSFFVEIGS